MQKYKEIQEQNEITFKKNLKNTKQMHNEIMKVEGLEHQKSLTRI